MRRKKKTNHDIVDIPKSDGTFEQAAIVPIRTMRSDTHAKNLLRRMYDRLFLKRSIHTTSLAQDERTTDTSSGAVISADNSTTVAKYYDQLYLEQDREARYLDFDRMDNESVILHRALNVVVDNMFAENEGANNSFKCTSDNSKIEQIINDLIHRLNLYADSPSIYRTGLKYGDSFEELVWDASRLIVRVKFLNPYRVKRQEDDYGRLDFEAPFLMFDDAGNVVSTMREWQVIHMRHAYIRGNKYGTSFLFSARRPYRILQMMEDGIAIMRLTRATDRYVFGVPVPRGVDATATKQIINEAKLTLKQRSNVDSDGKLDLTKSPLGDDEDFFIPVYESGPQASIKQLSGSNVVGQLNDVEYFQNQEIMATGVPKAYLNLERDVNSKATLGWEDIQYARMLRENQREFSSWLGDLFTRQLYALGIMVEHDSYVINFPVISFIDEEIKYTIERVKWEIATLAKSSFGIPTDWLLEHVIGLSSSDIDKILPNLAAPPLIQPNKTDVGKQQELDRLHQIVMSDMRLSSKISDLRDMMKVACQYDLATPVDFGPTQ